MGLSTWISWSDRALDRLYVLIAICIPISVKVYMFPIDLEVIFPAEPLIGLAFVIGLVKVYRGGFSTVDRTGLFGHPIFLVACMYLMVYTVAACASTMLLVSAKNLVVRVVYMSVFALMPFVVRAPYPTWLSMFSRTTRVLALIVVFTLVMQVQAGFDRNGASYAAFPFYSDHTIYAAALAFALAFSIFQTWRAWWSVTGKADGVAWILICALLILGLILSFCRAAWISVICGSLAAVPMVLRWHPRKVMSIYFVATILAGSAAVWVYRSQGGSMIDSNADNAGFMESVRSMTNVSSDASNKERLNRWSCAYRMFLDRPFTGFGPGTYQFNYVAYQRPGEITYLSTVDPGSPQMITRALSFSNDLMVRQNPQVFYTSGGTAHSEYLLALSESGIGPFLLMLALLAVIVHTGVRYCHHSGSGPERTLVLCITAALIAYHAHAVFNNFLDDCKISFFYWGMLGMLLYMDLRRTQNSAVH